MRWPAPIVNLYDSWLRRRIPASNQVTLNQRRIFILPTGYGVLFLLVAAAIFIAGINYENNLLLSFSFFLGSLFNIAIWHTYRNLSGVTLQAGNMRAGYAGARGALEVRVQARLRRGHTGLWLSWTNRSAQEISVSAAQQEALWLDIALSHRGKVYAPRLRIETRFPLGLLRAWSLVDLDHWCLAWPQPIASTACPAGGGDEETGEQTQRDGNDEFDGLRHYIAGDSLRAIHWKSLARESGLATKVFSEPGEGRLWLEWDRLAGHPVELRLSYLCWWILKMDRDNQPYGLRLPGTEIAPASGAAHREQLLLQLALFGAS